MGYFRLAALLVLMPLTAQAQMPPVLDFGTMAREEGASSDCAITFDDGPGRHTGALLDLLAARGVKATFFVLGEHVREFPDLIRRMVAEGHEVENHSWDHPDMRKLDEAARQKEIEDTVGLLKTLGVIPHFFRPPYGSYDRGLVDQARTDGLEVVLWTHDSIDWRYHTVAQLEGDIGVRGNGAHGVFLFHDIHDSTIAAMPAVLDDLKAKGCRFTTVAQWVEDTEQLRGGPVREVSASAGPGPAVQRAGGLKGWLRSLW